jgi:hypothetical protein
MPNGRPAQSADYAAARFEVGIIRDAALYGGYAPDTIELFKRLWSQEQIVSPGCAGKSQAGAGLPEQTILDFAQDAESRK